MYSCDVNILRYKRNNLLVTVVTHIAPELLVYNIGCVYLYSRNIELNLNNQKSFEDYVLKDQMRDSFRVIMVCENSCGQP